MNDTAQPGLPPGVQPGADEPRRPAALRQALASTRTHLVLLRFALVSLSSSIVDNVVFYLVFHATGTIAGAQIAGRILSVLFNYRFVRRAVFFSDHGHHILLPRYLLLVGVNTLLSYAGIRLLSANTSLNVIESKIVAETLLFAANFALQRAYVFTRRPSTL